MSSMAHGHLSEKGTGSRNPEPSIDQIRPLPFKPFPPRRDLPGPMPFAPSLPSKEMRRRIWHMAPGVLPFLFSPLPRIEGEALLAVEGLLIGLASILSFIAWKNYDAIARDGEKSCWLNALTYPLAALLVFVLFPTQPQLAGVVMVILAFGDGSATLFGLLYGKKRLPWNPEKSWVGFFAFFICSAPAATAIYWLLAYPTVPLQTALLCGMIPAMVCSLVESATTEGSDNLPVSATAALSVITCFVLWG